MASLTLNWYFCRMQGDISIDGQKLPKSLIEMIIETQVHSNDNNVIKFEDNSSAIVGFSPLSTLIPANSTQLSLFQLKSDVNRHIIFTAETHNFPTGVAPFQGATTGNLRRYKEHILQAVTIESYFLHLSFFLLFVPDCVCVHLLYSIPFVPCRRHWRSNP